MSTPPPPPGTAAVKSDIAPAPVGAPIETARASAGATASPAGENVVSAAPEHARPMPAPADDITRYADAPEPGQPVLSPDGSAVAHLVTRDDHHRLWLRSPDSRHSRQLPEPVLPVEPVWLPDGRVAVLAAFTGDAGAGAQQVTGTAGPNGAPVVLFTDQHGHLDGRLRLPDAAAHPRRMWAAGGLLYLLVTQDGGGRLLTVTLDGGEHRPLTGPEVAVEDADVATDGTVVVIARGAGIGSGSGAAGASHSNAPVLCRLLPSPGTENPRASGTAGPDRLVPLATSVRTPGTREQLLALSPDATQVVYGRDDGDGRYSVRCRPVTGPAGSGTPLAAGPGTVMRARWRGDSVVLQIFHGLRCELRETVPGAPRPQRTLAHTDGAYPSFTVAATTGRIAFVAQRWDAPPDIWVTPAAGGDTPRGQVTELHPDRPRPGPTARTLTWRSSDGTRVEGLLVRPAGTPADTALPLVTLVHGGPHHHWHAGWHGSWGNWARLLAERGFAVLCPNVRGSTGRGPEFTQAIRGDLATLPLADLLGGIDLLVADGTADPERLGIGGWSYGAYLSAWAITQTGRFRTAVLGAGIYDLHDLVTSSRLGPVWRGFCGTPTDPDDRTPYDELSPVRYTAGCRTATLLVHGTDDGKVPVRQSRQMRDALEAAGCPADLQELRGAGHALARSGDRKRLLERMAHWYLGHL